MLVVTPKVTETRAVRGDYVTMLADLQRLLQYVKARFAVMDSGYGPNTSSSQLARLHSPRYWWRLDCGTETCALYPQSR